MRLSTPVLAAILGLGALLTTSAAAAASSPGQDATPIARGAHISGVVQQQAAGPAAAGTATSCSTPGATNYKTNCHGTGRPVNETWIATNGSLLVAGANDYNSYNGQGQDGYYSSADGKTWSDAGPIDVFPHNTNNGAGDPGLAVDTGGVVYYSSLFFNFHNCGVGGVELLRRDPATGAWSFFQIASNSRKQFQDKPAIALGSANVFVSWTQFGSCTGVNVTSPIKVAVFPTGAASAAPSSILSVPGSTFSQGSSIAGDGGAGFWIAWEEFPSSTATTGAIMLAHFDGTIWNKPATISPAAFKDLPSPLPGFSFRDNSFPALTMVGTSPEVVWTSYDTGVGRAYLWSAGKVSTVAGNGGDQFFPSIRPGGSGGVFVAFSQVNAGTASYDQWLAHGTSLTRVSTASSFPSNDAFFAGQFIGDYNGMTVFGGGAHPTWTDIRGPDPNYNSWEMDAMEYAA